MKKQIRMITYLRIFGEKEDFPAKNVLNDVTIEEAIKVCSDDFFYAMERFDDIEKEKERVKFYLSLAKYLIRLCTRPTPYGLFAGVSLGTYDEKNNITVSNVKEHIKKARPDMEWIYGIIKLAENNPEIRNKIKVRFNDFTYVNGNRLEKPTNSCLQGFGRDLNNCASHSRYFSDELDAQIFIQRKTYVYFWHYMC